MPNQDVYLLQDATPWYSAYDVAWQALHAAAAAACRGSTPTGGSGTHVNVVLTRNSRGPESCDELCVATTWAPNCDAEISIYGNVGKATTNGQSVGWFYNYDCSSASQGWGGNEPSAPENEIMDFEEGAYSFCCCRK